MARVYSTSNPKRRSIMPRKTTASGGSRKRKAGTISAASTNTASAVKAGKTSKVGGPAASSKKTDCATGKLTASVSELEARVKADPRSVVHLRAFPPFQRRKRRAWLHVRMFLCVRRLCSCSNLCPLLAPFFPVTLFRSFFS